MRSSIPLAEEFFDAVASRQKSTTIRAGHRLYSLGSSRLISAKREIAVQIVRVRYKKVAELNQADATADGFQSIDELLTVLKRFYPSIKSSDDVTIVEFSPL